MAAKGHRGALLVPVRNPAGLGCGLSRAGTSHPPVELVVGRRPGRRLRSVSERSSATGAHPSTLFGPGSPSLEFLERNGRDALAGTGRHGCSGAE
jgi:hypothetical protein